MFEFQHDSVFTHVRANQHAPDKRERERDCGFEVFKNESEKRGRKDDLPWLKWE
jgi:hypothetical protein